MKWLSIFLFFCGSLCAVEKKNEIILCRHSLDAFDWAKTFISQAESAIEWSPCLTGGILFNEICALLEERLREQPRLRVHVFLSPQFLEPSNHACLQHIQKQYANRFHCVYTTTVVSLGRNVHCTDSHVKLLIVDGKYFVTGGSNYDYTIASEGTHPEPRRVKPIHIGSQLPNGARDQDVAGAGPLAEELRLLFYQLYATWQEYADTQRLSYRFFEMSPEKTGWFPIQGSVATVDLFHASPQVHWIAGSHCRPLLSGPHQTTNVITRTYEQWIDQAEYEICIANLYFSPTESLKQSLMRAAQRGISLVVLTNGIHEHTPAYTRLWACAHRLSYCHMLYGTEYSLNQEKECRNAVCCPTEIYEYDVDQLILHKKVMLVDEKRLLLGSYNLGLRSHEADFELDLAIEDEAICKEAKQIYLEDLGCARRISAGQIRAWYFNFWTHYQARIQTVLNVLI